MSEQNVRVRVKRLDREFAVPKRIADSGSEDSIRQHIYQSGQASFEEAFGRPRSEEYSPVDGPINTALVGAGRELYRAGSNISQLFGDKSAVQDQQEMARLAEPAKAERPISSFAGEMGAFMAVPGGKFAQGAFGAGLGALEGDTVGERFAGAGIGLTGALLGQKAGDYLGSRIQNKFQRSLKATDANARKELLDQGVPLMLSERTDVGKAIPRFFERGQFVLSGHSPFHNQQQKAMTRLVTRALGTNDDRLTREALGRAVTANRQVFEGAAERAGPRLAADRALRDQSADIIKEFDRVGSDSPQVKKIFNRFRKFVNSEDGFDSDVYLKLRSDLSAATQKSDIETSAIVAAIDALDERLARAVPDLASDLQLARDRFRLLLALRRGASLSPQGELNVPTFTKNLERIFSDFDVGAPLPRSLRDAGETIASFNQVAIPFLSSGTTENALAASLPMGGANVDPSVIVRALAGAAAPFAGGGTGGLIGGNVGRDLGLLTIE